MSLRLETERLILRPPKPQDLDGYLTFITSERAEYVGRKKTRFAGWKAFSAEAGHWTLYGYGPWAVTLKGSDTSVGHVGVWHPEGFPERELGWLLWDGAEGRGIAYEAAIAARDHDYDTHGTKTLVSYIDKRNARSIALAERLGAVLDEAAAPLDPGTITYRHTASEAFDD
ncbi:MAG: GNAT family N-acetyltransferase [Pseudomonadota bacterium]